MLGASFCSISRRGRRSRGVGKPGGSKLTLRDLHQVKTSQKEIKALEREGAEGREGGEKEDNPRGGGIQSQV